MAEPTTDHHALIVQPDERLALLAQKHRAGRTLTAYAEDFAAWEAWAASQPGYGVVWQSMPAPPAALAAWLLSLSRQGNTPATLRRRLEGVFQHHWLKGVDPGEIRRSRGLKNVLANLCRADPRPVRRVAPLMLADLRRLAELLSLPPTRLLDIRDRAILVFGWAAALRRAELCALELTDLELRPQGYLCRIREGKTGTRTVAIPYGSNPKTCPVRTVIAWLAINGHTEGTLFTQRGRPMKGQAVARMLKRRVAQIGLDGENYSGHSLRAGFITTADGAGVSAEVIARHTGHKNLAQLRAYVRHSSPWKNNAAMGIGL